MTLENALAVCQNSGLHGWDLVQFAQSLVGREMTYSYFNSWDTPQAAFEKGQGYCWHQAGALNWMLTRLGFDSRLVHAFKNQIPQKGLDGVVIKAHTSGHIWCRVIVGGVEKDVCPGHADNRPGQVHFTPLSRVKDWNPRIAFLSYYGSAAVNALRGRAFLKAKKKLLAKWNPQLCPCKKISCPRHRQCDACKAYHYAKNGLPNCE